MSVILVTHDLGVVSQMCDHVAVMYAGHIMEICDTITLFSTPRHPYTYGLLSSIPNSEKQELEPIIGAPPSLSNPPPGCPFEPRCKYKEELCAKELPLLMEISPGHSTRCHYWQKLNGVAGIISEKEVASNE